MKHLILRPARMRVIPLTSVILVIIILLTSCGARNPIPENIALQNTEPQNRKYFLDSLAYRMFGPDRDDGLVFYRFFTTHYPDIHSPYAKDILPYALEEEYIDTTRIDSNRQWLRFIVNPSFRHPYALTIENGDQPWLTVKITDGEGGYTSGRLTYMHKFRIDSADFATIFSKLDSVNFWARPRNLPKGSALKSDSTEARIFDGEAWTIEAIHNGRYNYIQRTSPNDIGGPAAQILANIALRLAKAADLEHCSALVDKDRNSRPRINP